MNNEAFEQWFKMNKSFNLSSLNGWNKNANEVLCRIVENHLDCMSECISSTCSTVSEQFKRISNSKPENFLNTQKDSIKESMAMWLSNSQKILNTSIETIEELSKLYANRDVMSFHSKKTEKEAE